MASRRVIALTVGGAALAIGIGYFIKRRGGLGGLFGGAQAPVIERRRAGDMTLTVYTDREMPLDMRVGIIQGLVRDTLKSGQVRELAHAIVGPGTRRVRVGKYNMTVRGAGCGTSDQRCKADAIGRWVAANVRYTGDIAPVKKGRNGPVEPIDYFQSAMRTVEIGGGDCDDQSGANCPLLKEVGVDCNHRITAPRRLADWQHIYSGAMINGQFVALDTTLPGYRTGRQAPYGRHVDFKAY